jgi:anti-sigma-K factor RskA
MDSPNPDSPDSSELDDAATHSLNALPDDEARNFEELVASNLELEEDLDSFRRVAANLLDGLPDIVPAASPEVWESISAAAGFTEPAAEPQTISTLTFRTLSRLSAAAALIAVLAVGAAAVLSTTRPDDTRSLAATAAESTGSLSVTLASPSGIESVSPEVVITADGIGYLVGDTLPKLNPDRTYQLWLIVDDRVISAAILGNDPEVVEFRAEGDIAGIAISNEVAGGVVVSAVEPTALWLSDTA